MGTPIISLKCGLEWTKQCLEQLVHWFHLIKNLINCIDFTRIYYTYLLNEYSVPVLFVDLKLYQSSGCVHYISLNRSFSIRELIWKPSKKQMFRHQYLDRLKWRQRVTNFRYLNNGDLKLSKCKAQINCFTISYFKRPRGKILHGSELTSVVNNLCWVTEHEQRQVTLLINIQKDNSQHVHLENNIRLLSWNVVLFMIFLKLKKILSWSD